MLPTQIGIPDKFVLPGPFSSQSSITLRTSLPIKTPLRNDYRRIEFRRKRQHFPHAFFRKSDSDQSNDNSPPQDDFVTRVLKENPCQVEPRYKIGDNLYTLKEKQNLGKKSHGSNSASEILKRLNLTGSNNNKSGDGVDYSQDVYLNDILRKSKGKLYVPEQIFVEELSEEAEFDNEFEMLPRMSFEDLQKSINTDMVQKITFKDEGAFGRKDLIVELKEIPGAKNLQRTKWSIKLTGNQVRTVLNEYNGPRYEIETQTMASVGNLPQYPNPVASSISSRVMVELGALTAAIGAAAIVISGFLASAAIAAASFVYVGTTYVIWPMAKSFLSVPLEVLFGVLEKTGEVLLDLFIYGGISSKLNEMWTLGVFSSAFNIAKPMVSVGLLMVVLLRFTLSRRPKNFRKWDIWQGIEFSQSKPQARVDGSTGVSFDDVAGIEIAVEELQELVKYLKTPELFDKMGIKPPHGVLLEGPPGCGKTLVAKAIAGEAGVPFYQMAGSEFVEVLVGVGSARIRDLFKRAKVNKPSVIFIDEIDALATRRQGIFSDKTDDLYNAATQERETTLNQLLIELDGFDTGKGVIFLAATNRKDLLDPALLRPGRFDRKIRIRPPNAKGRLEILQVHARKVKLSDSVDLSVYAQNLPGWSGARLAQLLQEAALVAVRNKHDSILQSDVGEAVDRLTVGPKRLALDLGQQGQRHRATTEVGTALTSHLLRRLENADVEPCDRISIHPRGQTLSQVVFNRLDDEKYIFERRPQLLHRLQVLLGGRAAEEVVFGRDTSKASVEYLADATWLARKVITIWNMENPMVIHGEPPPWRRQPKFVGPRLDFDGIAVADATDAARGASDIVLTEPGLSVIISAVLTSRAIFQRMKNYTIYAVSITIRIVFGFLFIALIWKFDFSPFMVLIIAILNDGTIMTISKDRVKPSPLPDSWKLKEIFATGIVLGGYLALMTVIFFWIMKDTDFFSDRFGVKSIRASETEMMAALYLQVSIVSQALIFVTRSRSWSFLERPGFLLMGAFLAAQLVATLIAVYADWSFARIKGIGWKWAGVVWLYSIVFYFPLDIMKFAIRYILSGKAWNNLLDNRTAFTTKKDYGREEREAQWAHAQRTLHGLQAPDASNMFNEKSSYRELSEIAEQAKRRAEVARLREVLTLKGHVESVVKLKGLDIDTIQQHYTV